MLSEPIELFLLNTGAEQITNGILVVLILAFVGAVFLRKINRAHGFTQYAPTLLTTLGILGTFAGIIAGLLHFDVNDIDNSIGKLLAGLKTAFITSLAGMFLSITYKLLVSTGWISPKANSEIDEDEIGIGELYSVMKEQVDGIAKLQAAVGGDNEGSLVGQMKLLRSDMGDNHKSIEKLVDPATRFLQNIMTAVYEQQGAFTQFQDRLWIKLQDFADMMSKSATEQVINALKEVIADFNQNLTEQFGENFKQLNAAVLELVQWQENYKQQLNQMSDQYAQGVQAITQTESSVAHISEEARVIPASMEVLKSVMEVNQHQLNELDRHLNAFKDIRDRAVEALPEIRHQIDSAVEGMTQTTEKFTGGIKESAEIMMLGITESGESLVKNSHRVNESLQGTSDLVVSNNEKSRELFDDFLNDASSHVRNLMQDLQEGGQKVQTSFEDAATALVIEVDGMRKDFETSLQDMRTKLSGAMQEMAEQQMRENQRILTGLSQNADQALKDTAESVEKQVRSLETALNHQMNSVMNELGRALTAITGQFTTDYKQLVNAMHNVTRMQGGR